MNKLFTRCFISRALALLVVITLTGLQLSAQTVRYSDSWSRKGFTLVESKTSNIAVDYSVEEFTLSPVDVKGESMVNVELPGVFLPGDEGAPNLPGEARYIAIPSGSQPHVRIMAQRVEVYENVNVAPAIRIPLEGDDNPIVCEKNNQIYSENAFYPANPVQISEVMPIRGVDVVLLGVTPFQYNPVTKQLKVYRDLQIQVENVGGNGQFGDVAYRNRFWDPIISDFVMNFASLPQVNYSERYTRHYNTEDDECEYIIITPTGADFVRWADTIKNFRTEQGIITKVFTIDEVGGNTTTAIENFINNAYNNWTLKPAACLLLGDYGTDGAKNIMAPIWDNYCVSDNIYADVVGNDYMPDVVMSRITANNNDQLTVMITKFLNYERNPPTSPDFYNHPITALGWQTERWFQICSETIGGFFKYKQGKDPVRINKIYQGTPGSVWSTATNTNTVVNYFGPNGQNYIPQSPTTLGGFDGGTATMINNAINAGSFLLQHRDHGMETGWGEPSYTNTNINGCNNQDLTFVMSINCLTGKYNWGSECFTEKFHRHTKTGYNSGALGLIAASETSYSFVNDSYVWGVYDHWWPDFMPDYGTQPVSRGLLPSFGNAAGKYHLKQSNWPYNTGNKAVTYALFHHHGESFSVIYSEVPQTLTMNHPVEVYENTPTLTIQATPGSTVALTLDGQIVGCEVATPAGVTFNLPATTAGQKLVVVGTLTNYYRYRAEIDVITDVLAANFTAPQTQFCDEASASFEDLSSGQPTAWEWTFEGGTPATSTEQNPTGIVYSTPGSYTVTLTVTKDGETNTYSAPSYITLGTTPIAPVANNAGTCFEMAVPDLTAEGEGLKWYSDEALTQLVNEGPAFTTGQTAVGSYTYYVTQTLTGCESAPVTSVLTISDYPTVVFEAPAPVCLNTAPFVISTVNPVGGTFAGTGINENNEFDASVAGAGNHELAYTYTNEFGCASTSNQTILVNNLPEVSLAPLSAVCQESEPITLSGGLPEGGTYVGENVENGIFNPIVAGDNAVGYSVTDATTGCENTAMQNITVNALPAVNIVADTTLCHNLTVILDATNEGATYAWSTGATTPTFEVDTTGVGLHGTRNISVTVTSAQGCVKAGESVVTFEDCTGVNELDNLSNLRLFPNPTTGILNIELAAKNRTDLNITVVNAQGNKVLASVYQNINGLFNAQLNLANLTDGVYFVMLESNGKVISQKVVVRK